MKPAEAYILNTPEPYKSILLQLQLLIEHTIPDAVLLYKWSLPFYYINGKQMFVFLNKTKTYVDVGFTRGAYLTKHPQHLVSKGRKHMKSLRYYSLEEINDVVLIELLQEAYAVKDKSIYDY